MPSRLNKVIVDYLINNTKNYKIYRKNTYYETNNILLVDFYAEHV